MHTACACVCVCMRMCVCVCESVFECVYTCIYMYIHVCIHIHIYIYMYTYMYQYPRGFWSGKSKSVWIAAECELRAAAPGLKPLRSPHARTSRIQKSPDLLFLLH